MLPAAEEVKESGTESIRLATTDSLDEFLLSLQIKVDAVSSQAALEETFFLGLRLNRGVKLDELRLHLGHDVEKFLPVMDELDAAGMLSRTGDNIQLTSRGRLLANEVFERFLDVKEEPAVVGNDG
jgi:coproporphyrinogen III oxidase-like Fe-S oxidoreductase